MEEGPPPFFPFRPPPPPRSAGGGDGDPPRGMGIPIYMLFPRLFVCPTVTTDSYRVEFEINLIIKFENGYMITENFQISIYRPLEV